MKSSQRTVAPCLAKMFARQVQFHLDPDVLFAKMTPLLVAQYIPAQDMERLAQRLQPTSNPGFRIQADQNLFTF